MDYNKRFLARRIFENKLVCLNEIFDEIDSLVREFKLENHPRFGDEHLKPFMGHSRDTILSAIKFFDPKNGEDVNDLDKMRASELVYHGQIMKLFKITEEALTNAYEICMSITSCVLMESITKQVPKEKKSSGKFEPVIDNVD